MPSRFTDATGVLFYTEDGTATGGGGMYYDLVAIKIQAVGICLSLGC